MPRLANAVPVLAARRIRTSGTASAQAARNDIDTLTEHRITLDSHHQARDAYRARADGRTPAPTPGAER